MKKGTFIVFEGIDGSGKSTQVRLLADHLSRQGYSLEIVWEPGGTPVGELIRKILLDPTYTDLDPITEALLFAGARAQQVVRRIRPALEQGKIVIGDRFADSTLAYQGFGHGLNLDLLLQVNFLATGGLKPNLTFVLDIPPEVGRARIHNRINRIEQNTFSFFNRVREGYLRLARAEPDRYIILNGCCSKEELHHQLLITVEGLLK